MRTFLALSVLLLASCVSPRPSASCEDPDTGQAVGLGTVRDNAVCTDLVPGGWAVAAIEEKEQENDNGR